MHQSKTLDNKGVYSPNQAEIQLDLRGAVPDMAHTPRETALALLQDDVPQGANMLWIDVLQSTNGPKAIVEGEDVLAVEDVGCCTVESFRTLEDKGLGDVAYLRSEPPC